MASTTASSVSSPVPSGIKTYGEKPKSFKIHQDGEAYYIGSEV